MSRMCVYTVLIHVCMFVCCDRNNQLLLNHHQSKRIKPRLISLQFLLRSVLHFHHYIHTSLTLTHTLIHLTYIHHSHSLAHTITHSLMLHEFTMFHFSIQSLYNHVLLPSLTPIFFLSPLGSLPPSLPPSQPPSPSLPYSGG